LLVNEQNLTLLTQFDEIYATRFGKAVEIAFVGLARDGTQIKCLPVGNV
jgi:hypothetical protein